jgi:hypothetical protein
MAENTYTLDGDDLSMIRNALLLRAVQSEREEYPDFSADLRELRERFWGTRSVVITYPEEG